MTAGEFRNGVTFEMDGQVQQVIEFQHVKPVSYTHLSASDSTHINPNPA